MSVRTNMFCLWCGPVGILMWLVGFLFLAGLIPPPDPAATAVEIAAFYGDNPTGIRAGLVLTMVGASLTAPWVAVITSQMKRAEGPNSPLTYLQLGCGMLDIVFFIIPALLMQAAAFRPERDPELILLLNDAAWLPFVGVWSVAFVQNLALGLLCFQDREQKVFPRWFGYYNMWSILLYIPGSLLYFYKDGPFAWNGALSWWLVVADFVAWFVVTFFIMRRAILNQERAATAAAQPMAVAAQTDDGAFVPSPSPTETPTDTVTAVPARTGG